MTLPEGGARLIVEDQPRSGAANMAVDETLLESAIDHQVATVRVYRWSEATLSLGYFQQSDELEVDEPLTALPRVRRLSGGGAILHHHEITYSLAFPATHPLLSNPSDLYTAAHEQIIAVLAKAGIEVDFRGEAGAVKLPRDQEPLLCFERGDPRDLVLGRFKVLGSAQRRRRGAVLQHGSLLLEASPHAPQLPGLRELVPAVSVPDSLSAEIGLALARLLPVDCEPVGLTDEEQAQANRLEQSRYRTLDWRRGRNRSDAGQSGGLPGDAS